MIRQRPLALAGRQKVKDRKTEGAGHAVRPAAGGKIAEKATLVAAGPGRTQAGTRPARSGTQALRSCRALPAAVVLTISHTEPGLQGDRSSAGTKPATLETGAEIQVPLFLNTGDRVKVDTRSRSYISRVTD